VDVGADEDLLSFISKLTVGVGAGGETDVVVVVWELILAWRVAAIAGGDITTGTGRGLHTVCEFWIVCDTVDVVVTVGTSTGEVPDSG